jgi:CRP-like cAMP-binding protein
MGALMRDTRSLFQFLAHSSWGQQLTHEQLVKVAATSRHEIFERNDSIVVYGSIGKCWIGVIEGLAAQAITTQEGDVAFLAAAGSGDWFGEGTLLRCGAWEYDATALRQTRTVLVPIETFDWLRKTSLAFNQFLSASLSARVEATQASLLGAMRRSAHSRMSAALLEISRAIGKGDPRAAIKLSQHEFGLFAGLSRSRAGLTLSQMRANGLIARDHEGIRIVNRAALISQSGEAHSNETSDKPWVFT